MVYYTKRTNNVPGPATRVCRANSISISPAVFAQLTRVSNTDADTQTTLRTCVANGRIHALHACFVVQKHTTRDIQITQNKQRRYRYNCSVFPYGNSVKESILTDSRRTQILNEWRWEGRRVDYGNKCKKACLTNHAHCLLQMVIWLYFIKIMVYREMLTTTIWKSEICHLSSTVAAFSSILITQAYIMPKYIHHTNRKPSLEVVPTNITSGPY